jgi:hypothetical protein
MTAKMNVRAVLAIVTLIAAACGGSDGDGDSGGGTGAANAVSRGEIREFGSVVVNGVTWRVAGATLALDDNPARTLGSEAEAGQHLRRGQVVTVRGRLDDDGRGGQATEIRFGEDFQGPVSDVAPDGSGFTVLGVTVIVDASTVFTTSAGAAASLSSVAPGTRVEVSGVPDAGGAFRATHVKIEDAPGELEAKGFVVNPGATGFQLALTPGGAPFLTVLAGGFGVPAAGSFVEVKSAGPVTAGSPPTITQSRAPEVEDRFSGDDGTRSEVEGIVTGGTLSEFTVGGTTVRTGPSTTYTGIPEDSTAQAEFAPGVKVEAEGTFQGGVLVATRVKFKDSARLGGTISNLVLSATAPSTATFSLNGKTVTTASNVQLQDVASVGDLASGAFVEIRGYPRANGVVLAQRLRVRDGGGDGRRPFLQGVVDAAASPNLTIMGITVSTTGAELEGEGEAPLGPQAFFAAIQPGRTVVKVRWDEGAPLTAPVREAEIEAEDD